MDMRAVILDVLRYLYHDLFVGEYNRITLFARDDSDPEIIRPYVRYRPHGAGLDEAGKSQASFRKGEGYAGRAWKFPHIYFAAPFPQFDSDVELEKYYVEELGIPKGSVLKISPFMRNVRVIFCYGFLDRNGDCPGVMSIDCLDPVAGTREEAQQLFVEKLTLNRVLPFLGVLLDSLRLRVDGLVNRNDLEGE